jgi:predicted PhzF superfamily epimerase YddE/YHI9
VRFATRSGVLIATPGEDGSITLDFPTAPLTAVELPEGIAEALGAEPLTAFDTGPNIGDLLLELPDEKTVHALRPDLKALAAYSEPTPLWPLTGRSVSAVRISPDCRPRPAPAGSAPGCAAGARC